MKDRTTLRGLGKGGGVFRGKFIASKIGKALWVGSPQPEMKARYPDDAAALGWQAGHWLYHRATGRDKGLPARQPVRQTTYQQETTSEARDNQRGKRQPARQETTSEARDNQRGKRQPARQETTSEADNLSMRLPTCL
jgi:hypothetical protein